MTREKAIEVLENRLSQCQYVYDTSQFPDISYPGAKREIDALEIALSALRPVSREQVEKVWRGEWIGNGGEKVGTIDGVPIKSATCSSCGHWLTASNEYDCEGHFCPACGKAMTDEAVEIVMERLEALYEVRKVRAGN